MDKSVYLRFVFLIAIAPVGVKGRSCELDQVSKPCGYCGVCKRVYSESTSGVCDDQYLISSGLFTNFNSSQCKLKDHCKHNKTLCQSISSSTGLCHVLYGAYKCQCKVGYFGKNCENKIDSKPPEQLYADVNNVAFTPIFYSAESATFYISFLRKGLGLKVYVDNGREKLVYNEEKCEHEIETLNKFCLGLFSGVNNIRICRGMTSQTERQFKNKGCLIKLEMTFPPDLDEKRAIYEYANPRMSNNIIANIEKTSVAVYNYFESSVNKPVLHYMFDMINIHKASDLKSKCFFGINLVNCGKTMRVMPRISAYSDMAILWSLNILAYDSDCQKYEKVETNWKVWRLEENHDELKDKPLLEMYQSKVYLIKEKPLTYGIYKVKLILTVGFSELFLREKAYCYFEVLPFLSQITLLGGSLRKVYYKQPITFEILQSTVPDRYEPDVNTKTVFTWRCDQPQDNICKPFKTSETVRRLKGPFPEIGSYKFTLDATTVDESGFKMEQHQETQVIEFSPVDILSLVIKCLKNCGGSTFKSNPQEIVHLKVSFEEQYPDVEVLKYNWKYKCLDDPQGLLNGVDDIRRDDNVDDTELVVNYNKLNVSSKYLFVVSLEDSSSYAEVVVETDQPPSGITCEVHPKKGIRGTTYFSINCTGQNKNNTIQSPIFEFYNRHDNESIGRMLGYSMTGDLRRIVLTRDKLFVCITNLFGSSTEMEIPVTLNPPPTSNSSAVRNRTNVYIGNYIDRMDLLSSKSDSSPSRWFWVDSTAAYLRSLGKMPAHESMGSILLENTLHKIACEKLVDSVEHKFKCSTILNLASIMRLATKVMSDSLSSSNMNPRLMSTTRTKNFVRSVLQCSSVVLKLNYLNKYKSSSIDVHNCLKASTFHTIDTLDSLVHIIALQIFPSIKQWYESASVHIFVQEIIPGYIDNMNRKTPAVKRSIKGFVEILEGFTYYTQVMIFQINPFWWGSGNKINTNVFSVTLYKEDKPVAIAETKQRLKYILGFNNFQPALVSGYVAQPDPTKCTEITDFEIATYRIIPEVLSKTFVKFTDLESNKTLRVLILKNVRPDFDLMNAKAVNITVNSNELLFDTDNIQDDSFHYIGILPGWDVEVGGVVNYTFVLFSARCAVWKQKAWMSGSKCIVDNDIDVDAEILSCSCSLLSLTVGGYVYVPANSLNPFSDLSIFLKIPDNPFIVSFLFVVFSVFSISLICARRKDRDDKNKLNTFLLQDNSVDDTHAYLVGVFTGSRVIAGTTSNVGFKLFGEKGTSRTHVFSSSKSPILQSGSDDWFLLFSPQNLGALLQIQLWIDYSGSWPNWYCKMVFVCDLSNYETSTFTVEKWFGVSLKEICLEKLIKTASTKELNTFGAILSDNIVYGFRDIHFFISLFHKHPRSVVTRTQRLSVVLSSVLLSICVSILVFAISSPVFEDYPTYHLSVEIFFYSFVCSIVATSFGLINMSYFRRCYSLNKNTNHSHSHFRYDKQCTVRKSSKLDSKDDFEHYKSKKNNFFKLYCKYVDKYAESCYFRPVTNYKSFTSININVGKQNLAWMITLIVIIVSSYIIIVSSLTFGEIKTSMWITCLLMSLVISIFVLLSIKVVAISLICSLRKVRIFDIFSHSIKTKKLSLVLEKEMYVKLHNKSSKKLFFDTYIAKEEERNKMVAKKHYRTIRIWVAAFIIESFFLLVILYLIMGEFKTLTYFQSSSTVCNEVLNKYICEEIYFYTDTSFYNLKNNVLKLVLPKLFKTKWYNGKDLSSNEIFLQETGWLNDITSRLIGDPQLLQVRVQKNLCRVPSVMSLHTVNCFSALSPSTVDRKNYSLGWTDEDWTAILFQESPWIFTEGVGVGIRTSDYYIAEGSYVTSLLNTLELASHVTKNLIDTNWIDLQTRITVLQFITYNPNNNIFTSSSFVTEIFPTHYIKATYTVKSIGLYYHKFTFQGIVFFLFAVFFLVRLIVTVNIMGVNTFFKDLWNCYDLFILFVFFSSVVDYAQLMYLLGKEQEVIISSVADKSVRLETVFEARDETIWSLSYTFVSVAVRFVRITRINDRCRQYLSDLVETRTELFCTLLISFVGLYRQFRLIMYFIEPPSAYQIIDILGFTTHYHPLQKEYNTMSGKVVALALFQLSNISLFSFTISLIHHHRQVKIRRISYGVQGSA